MIQGCQKQKLVLNSYYDRPIISFHLDQSFLVNPSLINLFQKSLKQVFYARGYTINHVEHASYVIHCTNFSILTTGIQSYDDMVNRGKFQNIDCMISIKKGEQLLLADYHCTYEHGILEADDFLWKNRYEHDTMKYICYMLALQIEAVCFKYIEGF
jgi:hypothetical protein